MSLLNPTTNLKSKIKKSFDTRLQKIIIELSTAIFTKYTTCLYKLAGDSAESSFKAQYKSFIRFFATEVSNFQYHLLPLLLSLVTKIASTAQQSDKLLILDRTNWKLGETNRNLMFIGTVVGHVFLPLLQCILDKQGNSNTQERLDLLSQLRLHIQSLQDYIIVGDREFIGMDWFEELSTLGYNFVFRTRDKAYLREMFNLLPTEKPCVSTLQARAKQKGHIRLILPIKGIHLYYYVIYIAENKPKHQFLHLVSTIDDPKRIATIYAKRWHIECFFKHIKSNSFNFEDTHLKDNDKVLIMSYILSLGYLLAIDKGMQFNYNKVVKMKNYKTKQKQTVQYPEISLFRFGLNILQQKYNTPKKLNMLINSYLKLFSKKCG